jgi:hypothetical protein
MVRLGYNAVPVTDMEDGVVFALPEASRFADRVLPPAAPPGTGLKFTFTVQVLPGWVCVPAHVPQSATKSLALGPRNPGCVLGSGTNGPGPFAVTVTCCTALVVPASCGPNVSDVGLNVALVLYPFPERGIDRGPIVELSFKPSVFSR